MCSDITAEINFFSHTVDGSIPWMDGNPKLGSIATNFVRAPAQLTIHDLRGRENSVDLDTNGFEVLKYDGDIHDKFDDNCETQRCYYAEIANILKKRLNASDVIVFNHIIRYRGPPHPGDQCDLTHKNPVYHPHVDNDPSSAHSKVKAILGEEKAKKAMQNRFQIINVWRLLGQHPITNVPLAICDYRSLDHKNDIHISEARGSEVTDSLYVISCNNKHAQQWYYLSQMQSNEMFVFKIFDSKPDVAQFGAHTAVKNESVPSTDVEQVSIEVRCIALYDE